MEVPSTSQDDVLALPIRTALFEALGELRRPATTQELAALVERHPNSVRIHLQRLAGPGVPGRRGAPPARSPPAAPPRSGPPASPGTAPATTTLSPAPPAARAGRRRPTASSAAGSPAPPAP